MAAIVSNTKRRERSRAAMIVADYRLDIERRFASMPNARNAKDVRKIIDLLRKIEIKILDAGEPPYVPPIVYPGDFSIEEMERAQEIIAEQEHNPFEG